MSKTTRILSFMSILFVGFLTSCVQDDDYKVPTIEVVEPDVTVNTTISGVKAMYTNGLVTFPAPADPALIMEAYVVSNDEAGNFYKVLILQDAPENPTAGIQIDIDDPSLFDLYKPGRKVYVKLNGLGMAKLNGVLHIGKIDGTSVGRISLDLYQNNIIRSAVVADLVPKVVTPSQFGDDLINTLIQIDNMELSAAEVGKPYGNAADTFTVNRNLKNCDDGSLTILRNSGFADFKNVPFPTGQGSIVAVFSKFNNDNQLFIRDTDDVMFDGERCDGPIDTGGGGTTDTAELPFSEDFTAYAAGQGVALNIEGWVNVNVNGGERVFDVREFSNNKYAQTSAFNSSENPYEVWLVTPGFDLTGAANPKLNFETNDGFYTGAALKALVSTNFTGDPTTATWTELPGVVYSTGHASGYGPSFTPSGAISLSTYVGQTVYIGFKYLGSSNGITTTYQIDNVAVTAN